jgi:hypothetical protein
MKNESIYLEFRGHPVRIIFQIYITCCGSNFCMIYNAKNYIYAYKKFRLKEFIEMSGAVFN